MATSLELAITAIRSGRKEEGRQLLNLLIQQNPNDEMAWLWMSSVVNTDEQRARCLYHVLAINPDSALARRGLEVLGIVVSDSRPVRIPRDSQPIPVQSTGAPMPKLPSSPVAPVPAGERRPFRVDPRAITQELPFKPLKEPFAGSSGAGQAEAAAPSGPAEAVAAAPPSSRRPSAFKPAAASKNGARSAAAPPAPGDQHPPVSPSESIMALSAALEQAELETDRAGAEVVPALYASPALPAGGQTWDTRPSPPVVAPQGQASVSLPSPWQPHSAAPPSNPGLAGHAQVTMGMPTPYAPPHNPWQPAPAFPANPTAAMPASSPYNQARQPSEPAPQVHSNVTMGMPGYSPGPYQVSWPQNPAFFSNATMSMPTMTPAMAGAHPGYGFQQPNHGLPSLAEFRAGQASRASTGSKRKEKAEEDEEEGVNVLAVIIFGSLSVTALGGLGMLILLMFTGS